MPPQLKLPLKRYLSPRQFATALSSIKAFRGTYVGDRLLRSLEAEGLLKPRIRLRWPDPIARRIWAERRNMTAQMREPLEPDGPSWDAAIALLLSLDRIGFFDAVHPFDSLEPRFHQFVQFGDEVSPLTPDERRVSVGNAEHPTLFDSHNVRDFYSGWQVLVAAEVADIGIHIRSNMSDDAVASRVRDAVRGRRLPEGTIFELFEPNRAIRGFREHQQVLDAAVWAHETGDRHLARMLSGQGGGRFELTYEQSHSWGEAQAEAARAAMLRFAIDPRSVIATCKFLASRWDEWNSDGRILMATAYRTYLAAVVKMLQLAETTTFAAVSEAVGRGGHWFKPILEVIWPDWMNDQKERLIRTLQPSLPTSGPGAVSTDELNAFAEFLDAERQEGIFIRLSTFERYAFEEVDVSLPGMQGEVQGLAIAIEQAVRSMGGVGDQLWEMFKRLWVDPEVARLLRQHDRLARQGRAGSEWDLLKAQIEELRRSSPAGAVVADIVMAHRVRGAVHYSLPEEGQFELERLFVTLLRAAIMTHAHISRTRQAAAAIARPSPNERADDEPNT